MITAFDLPICTPGVEVDPEVGSMPWPVGRVMRLKPRGSPALRELLARVEAGGGLDSGGFGTWLSSWGFVELGPGSTAKQPLWRLTAEGFAVLGVTP